MKYETALTELDEILKALREGQIPIDELDQRVKRAEELIHWCRERLRNVEAQLDQLEGGGESNELF